MAHIALLVAGITGRLNSSFEIARRLKKQGHRITYLCPIDVKTKVESQGYDYLQLKPINGDFKHKLVKDIQSSSWLKRFIFHLKNYSKHYGLGKEILGLEDYENQLKKVRADHFIIDMELHDLIFAAYSLNIPITLYTAWFSNKMGFGTKLPPLRTSIIPGRGITGSPIGILINWLFVKFKVQARIFVNKLSFRDYRRQVLKQYAKSIGFPTQSLIASNLPHLFCYTNLPIVTFALAEMDFPHTPNSNFIYAGPMVYAKRDMTFDKNTNDLIVHVISKKRAENKKIIYFSAGSILVPEVDFVNQVMEAVKSHEDWLTIISLGGKLSADAFKSIPSNVFLVSWTPQLKVLEYADCCITHAGVNTVFECVHFAVPMLVYSGKVADENGNAARIHYHQLGIMRDKDRDGAAEIEVHLKTILSDGIYQTNLNKMNAIYQSYKTRSISEIFQIES